MAEYDDENNLDENDLTPKMEELVRGFKRNQERIEEGLKGMAQLLFSYYSSLQKQGFTKEEALEIIKARGIT